MLTVLTLSESSVAMSVTDFPAASMIITWQDKRVVLRQRPLKTGLRMGEKLIAGDNPIIAYRRQRDLLIRKAYQF